MTVRIRVNEREVTLQAPVALDELRSRFKPDADLLICDSRPASPDRHITGGEEILLIRRGQPPTHEELESLRVSRHTSAVHEKLRAARVGVAGLGGLGSNVAVALTRLGVGHLVLADFDVVAPSNLSRQHYFVDQIGLTKVEALSDTLRRIDPYLVLDTHAVRLDPRNVPRLFSACQVLIEAFDQPDQKAMLIETALTELEETWVVAASGIAGYGPGEEVRTHRLGTRLFVVGDLTSECGPNVALMAPRVGVAAHNQANLALRLLLGAEDSR
jgi:sulfur carrier protein ThiS adenylyltransferase